MFFLPYKKTALYTIYYIGCRQDFHAHDEKETNGGRFITRRGMRAPLGQPMAALPLQALPCVHFIPENTSSIQKMSGWYTKNVRLACKNACLHRQLSVFSPRRKLGTAFANSRGNEAVSALTTAATPSKIIRVTRPSRPCNGGDAIENNQGNEAVSDLQRRRRRRYHPIIETAKGDKNGYQHHIFRFYLFFAVYKANFILV